MADRVVMVRMFWDFIGSPLRDLEELSLKISGMGVPFQLN
jgi:hypothetical protein